MNTTTHQHIPHNNQSNDKLRMAGAVGVLVLAAGLGLGTMMHSSAKAAADSQPAIAEPTDDNTNDGVTADDSTDLPAKGSNGNEDDGQTQSTQPDGDDQVQDEAPQTDDQPDSDDDAQDEAPETDDQPEGDDEVQGEEPETDGDEETDGDDDSDDSDGGVFDFPKPWDEGVEKPWLKDPLPTIPEHPELELEGLTPLPTIPEPDPSCCITPITIPPLPPVDEIVGMPPVYEIPGN